MQVGAMLQRPSIGPSEGFIRGHSMQGIVRTRPFRVPGKISPPEARSLSSSCVSLLPGERVGEHTTEGKEELLFVLEGVATLLLGGTATKIPAGEAAYVPPNATHDVANEGRSPLSYVYVTARTGKP